MMGFLLATSMPQLMLIVTNKVDKYFFHVCDNKVVNVTLDQLLTCFKLLTFVHSLEFDFY